MYVPYSVRSKPPTKENFVFSNQFAIFPVILDLVNDFKNGVQHISRSLLPLRTSFISYAMYYLIYLGVQLPMKVFWPMYLVNANKTSVICTNVNGPKVPYRLAGADSIKATTFMPNLNDIPGAFAIVSHVDRIWISYVADVQRCPDAKQIITLFEKNLDDIIAGKI